MLIRALPAFAFALALPFAAIVPFGAQMALAEGPAVKLTVTGEGVSAAAPDLATLSIGVTTRAATAAEALSANAIALAPVLERLRTAGIADRDLQTVNLSVTPDWSGNSFSSDGTPEIVGYTAMNVVSVTIRKLDDLGAVLDLAVADGANTLNGLSFGNADPRPALDAARGAAVDDARAKAAVLAAAVGQDLGRLLSISEGGGYGGPDPLFADAKAMPTLPIETGELSYSASVTMVWELAEQ